MKGTETRPTYYMAAALSMSQLPQNVTSRLHVTRAANFKQKSKGNQQVQERSIKVHVYGVAVLVLAVAALMSN